MIFAAACMLLHPFHVAIFETEWNAESGRFEMAMRLDPRDFSTALSKATKEKIDLEKADTDQIRPIILAYLKKRFTVRDADGTLAKWHYVGLENEPKFVWLYVELEPPSDAKMLKLSAMMLHEVAPSQVNTMLLSGKPTQSLRFSKSQPKHVIRYSKGAWTVDQSRR